MTETNLGKISKVYFGKRDGRIGLWLTLSGNWCVDTSYDCWDPEEITPDNENYKWTEKDREEIMIKIMRTISELLKKAKVNDVNDLLNKPIEFTSEKGLLKSWRILEEVL